MYDIEQLLFAPLGKEYCLYFYYLTITAFVLFALAVLKEGHLIMKGKSNVLPAILALLSPALLYFNNRLLYTMCVK